MARSLTLYLFCGPNPGLGWAGAAIRWVFALSCRASCCPKPPEMVRAALRFQGTRAFEKCTKSSQGAGDSQTTGGTPIRRFDKWDRKINAVIRTLDAELAASRCGSGKSVDAMKRFLDRHAETTVVEFKRLGLSEPLKEAQVKAAALFIGVV